MKTAAKIFIMISMVCGFWTIFPLIFGGIALKISKTGTTKSELTGSAICTLIFVNVLAGIFMLCIKDEDLAK